jgi:hypothetical protein
LTLVKSIDYSANLRSAIFWTLAVRYTKVLQELYLHLHNLKKENYCSQQPFCCTRHLFENKNPELDLVQLIATILEHWRCNQRKKKR